MTETWLTILLVGSAGLFGASFVSWQRQRPAPALLLLMAAAFLLRLAMAGLDPFLHDWDERYHALVARNLMSTPLRPTLHAIPALAYDYKAWCCNHIWLHKQPLFLWQIALALKAFGPNVMALRLPSALLGTLLLYPVYRLAQLLYHDPTTSYLAAVLAAFAYYTLEQTSGLIGMDHDDVAFTAYVGASIWAYYEYRASPRPGRWLVAVGVFTGAAVLCKWLTGLVVYAAWGLDLLTDPARRGVVRQYLEAGVSAAVATAVWLPWQLFIAHRYPLESAYERAYNTRHFGEALEGHGYAWNYHFTLFPDHYGVVGLLVVLGAAWALASPAHRRPAGLLLAVVGLIYAFFSVAATKMYSYTYVVSPLLLVLAARPLALFAALLARRFSSQPRLAVGAAAVLLLVVAVADARPWGIYAVHFQEESYGFYNLPLQRAPRTANARLYAQLAREVPPGYLVLNVPGGNEIQAMFHSGLAVYSWSPTPEQAQALLGQGWHFAAFETNHNQPLPGYIRASPGFQLIWGTPE